MTWCLDSVSWASEETEPRNVFWRGLDMRGLPDDELIPTRQHKSVPWGHEYTEALGTASPQFQDDDVTAVPHKQDLWGSSEFSATEDSKQRAARTDWHKATPRSLTIF